MSTVDIARGYLRRGWCPIPVQFKSKKPNTPDWQHMRLREDDLEGVFSGKINIGVVLGPPSNGLTDVDLDCREAIAIAPFMLPRTGAIFGRHSAPASHWLYYSSLASGATRATIPFKDPMKPTDDAMLLETRVGDARPIRYGLTGLADARSAADANTISNHP